MQDMAWFFGVIADTTPRMEISAIRRSAILSKCKRYRYVLKREWQPKLPGVLFVALNPSTADGEQDDPTVRRCIGFARSWGFGKLAIANLFALRSTDPSRLMRDDDPIGPENDRWLSDLAVQFTLTIAAWGAHEVAKDRAANVLRKLINVHHLGLTNAGYPKHPLYLPKITRPVRFSFADNFP
jgi:hypothetical protein